MLPRSEERRKFNFFSLFYGVVRTSAWFCGKLENPAGILVLKIKRFGTGLIQGYNWYDGSRKWVHVITNPFGTLGTNLLATVSF